MSPELSDASLTHILVVDDVPENVGILSKILESQGYKVQVADSGPMALTLVLASSPDLILLNMTLAGVDNYQVCKQLKGDDFTCDIPVIFILDDLANKVKAFTVGGADYITYPLEKVEIITKIEYQLKLRSLQGQLQQERKNHQETTKWLKIIERAIAESTNGIAIADAQAPDNPLVYVNQGFERITGYRAEEVLGKNCRFLQGKTRDQSDLGVIRKALNTQEPCHVLLQNYRADGTHFWNELNISPVHDQTGKVTHYIGLQNDVTDRVAVEEALQRSQSRLAEAEKLAHLGYWSFDLRSQSITWSEEVFRIYGLNSNHPPTYEQLMEQTHIDDWPEFEKNVAKSISQGIPYQHEIRIFRPKGEMRYTLGKGKVLRDQNGQIIRIFGTVQDITERKQVENALWESQKFLQLIIDTIPQAIFWKDRDLNYLGCNLSFSRFVGLNSTEDVIGKTDYDLPWEPTEANWYRQCDRQVIDTNKPEYRFLETMVRQDGDQRWIETSKIPLHNHHSEVVGVLGTFEDITEQRQIEEALWERETLLQTLGNNLDQGVIYQLIQKPDGSFNFSYISAGIERLVGVTPEAIIANPQILYDLMIDSDRQLYNQLLSASSHSLSGFDLQMRKRTPNGAIQWSQLRAVPRRLQDGCTTWDMLEMDITNLKQVEQQLAQRETQLRAIFEQAAVGINQADIKSGLFIRANQHFCELLGYREDELYQKTFKEVTHPEDLQKSSPLIEQLHRGEIDSISLEERYLHKNGTAIWTQVSFSLIYDSEGEAICHLAIVVDISDRRRAEEALKYSQARLESIATNIPGAIYSYVARAKDAFWFEYISEGCRELFELEPEQVLADANILFKQIHPEDYNIYYHKLVKSIVDLTSFSHEWRHILPSGKIRWILGNSRPERRENGDIFWHGVVLDVSDRKKAEEELLRAKEVAEAASQAKTTFLTNMSHELRTPLNAVLGFTQLLNYGDNLTPHQHNNLNIIQRSGEHLLGLINDILDLSKIEAGRVTLSAEDFDLWRMLDELKDLFSLKASQKNLYLDFVYSSNLPQYIRSDRLKLRQIMINLIGNAIKFTERGRIIITASHQYQYSSEKICSLKLSVSDSGVGMTPEEIEQLYQPFFQAQAGINSQEGTGLGLTICQKYLQLLGSEMKIYSEVGKGTTFEFSINVITLDYKPGETSSIIHYTTRANSETYPKITNDQNHHRILIVEDQSYNRQLLYQILSPLGFEIQQATDGEQAIDVWENFCPHLIWMDLRIPLIDGYEVTREIRRREKSQGLSISSPERTIIIALTASAFTEERILAMEVGCDEFVHKPIEVSKIMTYIAKFFGNQYHLSETRQEVESISPDVDKIANQLAEMPLKWRSALADAVMTLNEPEMNSLIEEISPQASELAIALRQCAENFDYESIWEMLEVQPDLNLG